MRKVGWFKSAFAAYDEKIINTLPEAETRFRALFANEDKELQNAVGRRWKEIKKTVFRDAQVSAVFDIAATIATVLLVLVLNVIGPIYGWYFLATSANGFWTGVGFFFAFWAATLLITILIGMIINVLDKRTDISGIAISLGIIILAGLGLLGYLKFSSLAGTFWFSLFRSVCLSISVSVTLFFVVTFCLDFLGRIIVRKRLSPSVRFQLISLLWETIEENRNGKWKFDNKKKKGLLLAIEKIARLIENKIAVEFDTYDKTTNQWAITVFGEIGQAVRTLKKEIILPGIESQETTQNQLIKLLNVVVTENWQVFERTGSTPKVSSFKKMVKIIVKLFVMFFPFAAVATIVPFEFMKLENEIKTGLYVITGIWAMINLFLAIDPDFGDKFRLTKDVLSLNVFRKKGVGE